MYMSGTKHKIVQETVGWQKKLFEKIFSNDFSLSMSEGGGDSRMA